MKITYCLKNIIKFFINIMMVIIFISSVYASYTNKFDLPSPISPIGFKQDGDSIRYYYDVGNYYRDGWHWIDNNSDGIYECYYFNILGHLYIDSITPSGYYVNDKGQLMIDNTVQHKSLFEIFDPATMSIIKKLQVEKEKPLDAMCTEILKELKSELSYYVNFKKEELHQMTLIRDNSKSKVRNELSICENHLDSIGNKFSRELSKARDEKSIKNSDWDKATLLIGDECKKHKKELRDFITPYIDSMINYFID